MARSEQKAEQPKYNYGDLYDLLDGQIDNLPRNVNPVLRDHLNAARELANAIVNSQPQQQQ